MGEKPISERTPIQIGVVISVGVLIVSGVWWAAIVSTKLDQVIRNQGVVDLAMSKAIAEVEVVKARVTAIELVGSQPMLLRITALERTVSEIKKQ